MPIKPRLELTWIGKDARPRLEPRILIENPEQSYHAPHRVTDQDQFDNRLIFGDNLLALKALEREFTGKVKCVFIDPPYNTGSAFSHYDDGLEHSIWLSLMRDRLELLHRLLAEDGSIWITIDDHEAHYLKVLCDEIFGRVNFVANAIWQKKFSPQNDAKWLSDNHDHILIYAKNKQIWRPNLLPRSEKMNSRFKNPDSDPRGLWISSDMTVKTYSASYDYPIKTPSGELIKPVKGRCWFTSYEKMQELIVDNRVWFGESGKNTPRIKKFLSEVKDGITALTIWTYQEVGHNQDAKKEIKEFNDTLVFDTPKPEKLLDRILTLATNPGDLVLDSFAGSGTTGAVAHKMGRRWIMIELGEHCHTHIIPRLRKVIDGADPGGITQAVGWQGGGGFRYYRLAPSLLEKDHWGNWIIAKSYDAARLAEAVCKLMGFTYAPSAQHYWQHGHSTERDFIYVTTQSLSHDQLRSLAEAVGEQYSLLVCCKAFYTDHPDAFPNLTISKIPQAVLHQCEWGKDDYSLNVANLPMADPQSVAPPESSSARTVSSQQRGLFSNKE